ncbi:hypothetical protein [Bathymodiolus platifrons methanotrophic gill symbiont]|uniref:hypothetical protein n=1 Tax=Bathymodiolus platifrons methanotrophic gill symbiont TaxID=113268 RepID=UPI00142E6407|nr:hypothetical protein [Bathymodiolus platifrons methanotrophic gill symbiont]
MIDHKVPAVIELKIDSVNGGQADSPLRALLEGLAYCAIIEKNLVKISAEVASKFIKN